MRSGANTMTSPQDHLRVPLASPVFARNTPTSRRQKQPDLLMRTMLDRACAFRFQARVPRLCQSCETNGTMIRSRDTARRAVARGHRKFHDFRYKTVARVIPQRPAVVDPARQTAMGRTPLQWPATHLMMGREYE